MKDGCRRTNCGFGCAGGKGAVFVESACDRVETESAVEGSPELGPIGKGGEQVFHRMPKGPAPAGIEIEESAVLVKGDEPGVKAVFAKVDKAHGDATNSLRGTAWEVGKWGYCA